MTDPIEFGKKMFFASLNYSQAMSAYYTGTLKYLCDFSEPLWTALESFNSVEEKKLKSHSYFENMRDHADLFHFNMDVAKRGYKSSLRSMNDYHSRQMSEAFSAWLNTIYDSSDGEDIESLARRKASLMKGIVWDYPEIIRDIETEYGFKLDNGGFVKKAETDRFYLYQVLPNKKGVKVDKSGKPILIIPPYVLGANILCFLPDEGKSYVHAYANQGIPTYIRIIKDIQTNPAVQKLDGESDTLDTKQFCEVLKKEYGKSVTLNGFCQGGFMAISSILSGELDNLVDALINCVSPIDGTRSLALVDYLKHLPQRFRDLGYAVKTLPNGNEIVDGKVMSWVYKLKSMDKEAPIFTFYRDMLMLEKTNMKISKTAAAINHWLIYDRTDLPVGITKMSFDSYTIPISSDGTLPIKLFGRKLNFKYIKEKGIKFQICYAERDDLVDAPASLAPLDFIDAEVTVFPKGHGAIATSWSNPESECALQKSFNGYRGPVKYQLDLNKK